MNKYLELGQIVNVKGLKGEVKVNPFTEDATKFEKIKSIVVKSKNQNTEYEIEKVGYHKNQNSYILVDRDVFGELPEGVYYLADLIGLDVYTEDESRFLGKVDDIFQTGSNDVYVVKDETGKELYLPGIPDCIKKIDLENSKILVNLIKGLE